MGNLFTTFTNCRLCINGQIVEGERLVVSQDNGLILKSTGYIGGEIVDLDDQIIAPGFLDLHTNGVKGFHFTAFDNESQYRAKLEETAQYYVSQGVTAFWATIPTVESDLYQKILPSLTPTSFPTGASLLGAHLEGPYLHPTRPGAHTPSLFQPASTPPESLFGPTALTSTTLKLVTLAPDIPSSTPLIKSLASRGVRVSLGHSSATYAQGLAALAAGATGLTHTLNCMPGLAHHRAAADPGLAALITLPDATTARPRPPYYGILADGVHLHPRIATLLFRASASRAMLVSDSTEMAGLPDGLYGGNAQIRHGQRKVGDRVTLEGSETLAGSCVTVGQCVKNMVGWSGCGVAEAVRATTENVADFMGLADRGKLEVGRRADFVVLDDEGDVKETWIAGEKVWEK